MSVLVIYITGILLMTKAETGSGWLTVCTESAHFKVYTSRDGLWVTALCGKYYSTGVRHVHESGKKKVV